VGGGVKLEQAVMTLEDAINNVCAYLHMQGSVFTLYRAWQFEGGQTFKVAMHQVQPEDKMRTFDVLPAELVDVWDVKEVELAGSITHT
jgi:hypothetical protein